MMANRPESEIALGALVIAASALIAFVWVPLDVETGAFETVRRRLVVGDALAPLVASFMLALGGLLVLVEQTPTRQADFPTWRNVQYAAGMVLLFVIAFTIMRWAGPLSVWLFAEEGRDYRILRDSVPWKHVGYFFGGSLLVAGPIALVERRTRWQSLAIACGATLVLILLYDLPFDDLLLPPNGDV